MSQRVDATRIAPEPAGVGARRTLGQALAHCAAQFGAAPAVLAPGREALTHAQLAARCEALIATLRSAGLRCEDRVAVALPKSADGAVVTLALASAACCVPLDPGAPAPELRLALSRARCNWVLAAPETPAWQCGRELGLASVGVHASSARGIELELPTPHRPAAPRHGPAQSQPEDVALVLQTSGSTAAPKLVPLRHHQLLAAAANLARSLALGPADRGLAMLPLFHVGGLVDLLLGPLAVGGSVVVTESPGAPAFFAALRAHAPTWYQGVPTMLREVLALAQLDPARIAGHRLRFIRAVSAALPERLERELEAVFGCPVIAIYGMTETAGVIASNPLPPGVRKPGSVGPSAGPALRVRRADGTWAEAGESGEICVRGETVIASYEAGDAPHGASFDGAWLRTGDLGHLDADGYLFLEGRIKELINRGGEKIAPAQVEQYLLAHPQVAQALACAMPHPTLGEEVALAAVPAPGTRPDGAELRAFLAERLAAHKVPRHVHLVETLPLGPTGKPDRRALAARLAGASPAAPAHAAPAAPDTPLRERLAALWRRALGVEQVAPDDDFFDLGGDSLTAVSVMLELQAHTGLELPAGVLYEHPTVRMLAGFLEGLPRSAELVAFLAQPPPDSPLPPGLYAQLQAQMHGWSGVRAHPHALVVGHRTDRPRAPLFWVVNGHGELAATLRHLDPQRAVYGMRSLFGLEGDSAHNRRLLGRHLAGEIAALQPAGPVLLGGFCSGGRVALEIADALCALGREVGLLCLLDTRVHRSYAGDVLLLHTRRTRLPPLGPAADPRRGYRRYYRGRVSERRLGVSHSEVLGRGAARTVRALDQALRRYEAGTLAWSGGEPPPQALPEAVCRAQITLLSREPLRWLARARVGVGVRLTNAGAGTWPATRESGLLLAASLRRPPVTPGAALRGRRRADGWCALTQALAPGASVELDIPLRVRARPGRYVLELDLLEDGAAWFADRGSTPLEVPVEVLRAPGIAGVFHRLLWRPRA